MIASCVGTRTFALPQQKVMTFFYQFCLKLAVLSHGRQVIMGMHRVHLTSAQLLRSGISALELIVLIVELTLMVVLNLYWPFSAKMDTLASQ